MKLLNQRLSRDGERLYTEGEHVDDNGKPHPVSISTSRQRLHNIVVDHGGLDNIGVNLTDDGLREFVKRLFGKG